MIRPDETTQDYIKRDPIVRCELCKREMCFRPEEIERGTTKRRRPLPFAAYCTDCATPLIAFFDERSRRDEV